MGLFDKLFGGSKKNAPSPKTNFTPTDQLMDEGVFWNIIQKTKDQAEGDFDQQQEALADELRTMSPDDIIQFDNRFRYFRGEANTWELWGAIYIIHGGCSDDAFGDFREWVIGQGKDFYTKTLKNPESLVELEPEEIDDVEWEGLGYIPSAIFEEITGTEIPSLFEENHETTGDMWSEDGDDLKRMFPKLIEKYPDNI